MCAGKFLEDFLAHRSNLVANGWAELIYGLPFLLPCPRPFVRVRTRTNPHVGWIGHVGQVREGWLDDTWRLVS